MRSKFALKSIDAVVFDIDGTLIDNIAYHERAWLAFSRKYGLHLTAYEFRHVFFGKNNEKILEGIFKKRLSKREIAGFAEEKEGLKMAMASAAPKRNRQFVLRRLGLNGSFDLVVGDEDIRNGKPHPEIYKKAARRLGVPPRRCLAFEDSPAGVESAKRAGMRVVGVLTGYSQKDLRRADCTVRDFSEIELG